MARIKGSTMTKKRRNKIIGMAKGYENAGASYCIPPKSNEKNPWDCDWWLYKERHLVECFFQKLKQFRRVATRYDKLAKRFLAFVQLACIMVWLA